MGAKIWQTDFFGIFCTNFYFGTRKCMYKIPFTEFSLPVKTTFHPTNEWFQSQQERVTCSLIGSPPAKLYPVNLNWPVFPNRYHLYECAVSFQIMISSLVSLLLRNNSTAVIYSTKLFQRSCRQLSPGSRLRLVTGGLLEVTKTVRGVKERASRGVSVRNCYRLAVIRVIKQLRSALSSRVIQM